MAGTVDRRSPDLVLTPSEDAGTPTRLYEVRPCHPTGTTATAYSPESRLRPEHFRGGYEMVHEGDEVASTRYFTKVTSLPRSL
jgi:hypothetical protein